MTAARRAAIDRSRRTETRQRHHEAAADEAPRLFLPPPAGDEGLCRDALEQALRELPEEQRQAVIMHVWSGLTFPQIAEALEISVNTAASRCRYGLTRMRRSLQPLYNELQ
jgi:RNA polymerase sigma-70 factor (ECF subfamily)